MSLNLLLRNSYHYDLPKELIAQYPADKREASRLMHLDRQVGSIEHKNFTDILDILSEGEVLVLNNSKVFPARLFGTKENGSKIEVFLLHPTDRNTWKCLVHPGKRLKEAQWLQFSDDFSGYIETSDYEGIREIRFEYQGDFWDKIFRVGHIPLPPYIARTDDKSDIERYQTVYAKELGSVAAPTAGLHFSSSILDKLKEKGVIITELTLHVGIGTFRPVKTENITEHTMHSECAEITQEAADTINCAKREGRRVVAVGTTTVRTLESFWDGNKLQTGNRWTDIFIYPGYKFGVPDAMITNFHLPESTLLMMISAFAGYDLVMNAYKQAVAEHYRFFSYGDAMVIE